MKKTERIRPVFARRPLAAAVLVEGLRRAELSPRPETIAEDRAGLRDALAAIAREKAGIAKAGVPLFSNVAPPDARTAIAETAAALSAPFHDVRAEVHTDAVCTPTGWRARFTTPIRTYADLPLNLPGAHQRDNAALALRLVEHVLPGNPTDALRTAWADVPHWSGLRGRSERIAEKPVVVLDVAHNADGLRAALANARAMLGPGGRLTLALGLMRLGLRPCQWRAIDSRSTCGCSSSKGSGQTPSRGCRRLLLGLGG